MLPGIIPSLGMSAAGGGVPGNDIFTTLLLTFDDGNFLNKGMGCTQRRVGTPYGTTQINSTTVKVGTGSMYLPGGSYLYMPSSSADFDFGAGNFTVDWWEYRISTPDGSCFVRRSADTNPQGFLLGYSSGGVWQVYMSSDGSSWNIAGGVNCGAIQLNVWNHFAVVRNGNTFLVFKNGTQVATWTSSLSLYPGNGGLYFGPWVAHWTGYMDQIRFSKGIARWTTTFTTPTAPYGPIPDYSDYHTVLLLHGEGVNGSQATADSSVYARGGLGMANSAQVTTNYKKFGVSGIYTDYNSSYVYYGTNEDFNFGYGDFTIDWWEYRHDAADSRPFLVRDSSNLTYQPYMFGYSSAGSLYCYGSNDQANWNVVSSLNMGTFTVNVWSHRAIVRKGTTFYAFKDGVLQSTQASSQPFPGNGGSLIWSYWNAGGTVYGGYFSFDEFRMTKGLARWTVNFTPPYLPYGSEGLPVLLMHMEGANASTTFTDSSPVVRGNATVYGNSQISTAQFKFGASSAFFDGSGDYITFPDDSAWVMSGDYTIDCWIRLRNLPPAGRNSVIASQTNAADSNNIWFFFIDVNGGIGFFTRVVGQADYAFQAPGGTVAVNTWQHVALVISSSIPRVFVNGILVSTGAALVNAQRVDMTGPITIGDWGQNYYFDGYIDELRITKDVALWAANFTPPTLFKPTDLGTDLLGWFDGADAASVQITGSGVSQWTNKGVGSLTLTQTTDANRPTYASNAVTFTTPQMLNAANSPAIYDLILVGKPKPLTTDWRTLLRSPSGPHQIIIDMTSTKIGSYNPVGGFFPAGSLTWGNVAGIAYARISDSAPTMLSRDGGALTSTGTTFASGTANFTAFGAFMGPPPSQGWGDVNEIIFIPYNSSDSVRQKLEGYLAYKWGLTGLLPAGHPYKTALPYK